MQNVKCRILYRDSCCQAERGKGSPVRPALLRLKLQHLIVNISKLHGLADCNLSRVRSIKPHDQTEKRSLTGAIRPDNTYDTCWRQHEIQVFVQKLVSISF